MNKIKNSSYQIWLQPLNNLPHKHILAMDDPSRKCYKYHQYEYTTTPLVHPFRLVMHHYKDKGWIDSVSRSTTKRNYPKIDKEVLEMTKFCCDYSKINKVFRKQYLYKYKSELHSYQHMSIIGLPHLVDQETSSNAHYVV